MSSSPVPTKMKFVPAGNEMKQDESTSPMSGEVLTFSLCFWYKRVIIVSVVCYFFQMGAEYKQVLTRLS